MSDDIVKRLRQKHFQFRVAVGINSSIVLDTIYSEAADEIERLKAELEKLRNV